MIDTLEKSTIDIYGIGKYENILSLMLRPNVSEKDDNTTTHPCRGK